MGMTFNMAQGLCWAGIIIAWIPTFAGMHPIDGIPIYALAVVLIVFPFVYDKLWGLELS